MRKLSVVAKVQAVTHTQLLGDESEIVSQAPVALGSEDILVRVFAGEHKYF